MDDCDRDFSGIPVGNVLAGFYLSYIKALFDTGKVVLEPIGYKNRFAIGGFNDVLQSIQLSVMKLDDFTGIGINPMEVPIIS